MSKITALLDELHNLRQAAAQLDADIERLVPADLIERRDCLAARVKELEEDIKRRAEFIPDGQAHTLVGQWLQLVWQPETPVAYVRKAHWAIKKRGK